MLTKMRPDILPSLFFVNNWWQIAQNVSYFDALGDPSPLTHAQLRMKQCEKLRWYKMDPRLISWLVR